MSQAQRAENCMEKNYTPSFLKSLSGKNVFIKTRSFGEIEIPEELVFQFPEGILGFNYVNRFAFLQEPNSPFIWMQAVEEPDLAFITIEPSSFLKDYELSIAGGEVENIGAKNVSELIILFIVTIPDNPSEMTANLQGPVILCTKSGKGRQAISLSDKYKVRHRIISEDAQKGSEG